MDKLYIRSLESQIRTYLYQGLDHDSGGEMMDHKITFVSAGFEWDIRIDEDVIGDYLWQIENRNYNFDGEYDDIKPKEAKIERIVDDYIKFHEVEIKAKQPKYGRIQHFYQRKDNGALSAEEHIRQEDGKGGWLDDYEGDYEETFQNVVIPDDLEPSDIEAWDNDFDVCLGWKFMGFVKYESLNHDLEDFFEFDEVECDDEDDLTEDLAEILGCPIEEVCQEDIERQRSCGWSMRNGSYYCLFCGGSVGRKKPILEQKCCGTCRTKLN